MLCAHLLADLGQSAVWLLVSEASCTGMKYCLCWDRVPEEVAKVASRTCQASLGRDN